MAPVKLRNKTGQLEIGYVDKSGKVSLIYGATEVVFFSDGLAEVQQNGKSGFIDKNMKFVIQPHFTFVRSFTDGRTWINDRLADGNYEEFYIDKSGKKVITNFGKYGGDFSEGFATFESKYVGVGYMDTDGKVVIKPNFLNACSFKEGLACAKDYKGKWGFIDKTGKIIVEPKFEKASWINGLGFVELFGKQRYINSKNIFVW